MFQRKNRVANVANRVASMPETGQHTEMVFFHDLVQAPEGAEEAEWKKANAALQADTALATDHHQMPTGCETGNSCEFVVPPGPDSPAQSLKTQTFQNLVKMEFMSGPLSGAQMFFNKSAATPYVYVYYPKALSRFCGHDVVLRGSLAKPGEAAQMKSHVKADVNGTHDFFELGQNKMEVDFAPNNDHYEVHTGKVDLAVDRVMTEPVGEHPFQLPKETQVVHMEDHDEFMQVLLHEKIPSSVCPDPFLRAAEFGQLVQLEGTHSHLDASLDGKGSRRRREKKVRTGVGAGMMAAGGAYMLMGPGNGLTGAVVMGAGACVIWC